MLKLARSGGTLKTIWTEDTPSFAGESLRVFVRAFDTDRGVACVGYFFGSSDDASKVDRARAVIQMRFE